jgi:hypothetical protein
MAQKLHQQSTFAQKDGNTFLHYGFIVGCGVQKMEILDGFM